MWELNVLATEIHFVSFCQGLLLRKRQREELETEEPRLRVGVSFLAAVPLLWAAALFRAGVQACICVVDNFSWWLWKKSLLERKRG